MGCAEHREGMHGSAVIQDLHRVWDGQAGWMWHDVERSPAQGSRVYDKTHILQCSKTQWQAS